MVNSLEFHSTRKRVKNADIFSAGGKMFGRRDEPYAIYQQPANKVKQKIQEKKGHDKKAVVTGG